MKRLIYELTFPGWAVFAASMCLCAVGLLCIIAALGQGELLAGTSLKQITFLSASIIAG